MRWELEFLKSRVKTTLKQPVYRLYEQRLARSIKKDKTPTHVGLILDGNRRFAREKGLGSVVKGHAAGADNVHDLLDWCEEFSIQMVTLWIFSLDNFQRAPEEVEGLFSLIEHKTRTLTNDEKIHNKEVRLNYIGHTALLPDSLQEAIRDAEAATAGYTRFQLNIAIAYGGREEITDAFGAYLRDCAAKDIALDDIPSRLTPQSIEPFLYTSGMPEPDLIIRTSGEIRLSGFLLWQSAYAEYYFCDVLWPDFRKIDFMRALRVYAKRQRRYGK